MALAIFDLDNTLIAGDSDYLWCKYMVDEGLVDSEQFWLDNERFYQDYQAGKMNMDDYLAFSLEPLANRTVTDLQSHHRQFMEREIRPIMLPQAQQLVARHRDNGDHLMIITATNRFVAAPIADLFEVDTLLATELEKVGNHYTGRTVGTMTYQQGKVTRLVQWLAVHPEQTLIGSTFYSDSHNDLPLLGRVDNPIAVDPDERLRTLATERFWKVISLR